MVEDMHEKSSGAMTEVRVEAGLHRGSARGPPLTGGVTGWLMRLDRNLR